MADPGFQARGAHLKTLCHAEVGAKILGGISCEKSRFYAKKVGAKIFGVFRVKNHDFTPKKSYFLQF
jgi:hypothetical protein